MSRPQGAHPRHDPPKPPSTRPPTSSLDASRAGQSHEVYVQIANLQMAKARQKRIRDSLQKQVATCEEEIAEIEQKIQALYDRAGLEPKNPDDRPAPEVQSGGDDGFEYEY
jgi:uncharacterized coiled-coil protein SlyX